MSSSVSALLLVVSAVFAGATVTTYSSTGGVRLDFIALYVDPASVPSIQKITTFGSSTLRSTWSGCSAACANLAYTGTPCNVFRADVDGSSPSYSCMVGNANMSALNTGASPMVANAQVYHFTNKVNVLL